jgi:hypothetical protein
LNKFENFLYGCCDTVTNISKDTRNNCDFIVSEKVIVDFDEWAVKENNLREERSSNDINRKKSPDTIYFVDNKKIVFVEFKYRAKSNIMSNEELKKLKEKGEDGYSVLINLYRKFINDNRIKNNPKPKIQTYYVVYSSEKQKELEHRSKRKSAKKRLAHQLLNEISEERNFQLISDEVYIKKYLGD